MKQLRVHELIDRPVVTQTGVKIGVLKDIIIDTDSNRVLQLCVKRGLVSSQELIIGCDAVISIGSTEIVVKDAFVPHDHVMVA